MDTTPTLESSGDREPAPGELRLVEELVNTYDLTGGSDRLADAEGLAAWLQAMGLADPDAAGRPSAADLARVVEVREALRDVLGANSGEELDAQAAAVLEQESSRVGLRVRVDEHGLPRLTPTGEGVDGAVARILAAVVTAGVDGTWRRLKTCGDDACRWAFYDRSRNGAGTWCSMASCGNRAKARRHRTRTKGGAHQHS